jgi:hypothetical protein
MLLQAQAQPGRPDAISSFLAEVREGTLGAGRTKPISIALVREEDDA